jgi:hypothetical protein
MKEVSTIGVDLAKSVFQVHEVDATGKVLVRRQCDAYLVRTGRARFSNGCAARRATAAKGARSAGQPITSSRLPKLRHQVGVTAP